MHPGQKRQVEKTSLSLQHRGIQGSDNVGLKVAEICGLDAAQGAENQQRCLHLQCHDHKLCFRMSLSVVPSVTSRNKIREGD